MNLVPFDGNYYKLFYSTPAKNTTVFLNIYSVAYLQSFPLSTTNHNDRFFS